MHEYKEFYIMNIPKHSRHSQITIPSIFLSSHVLLMGLSVCPLQFYKQFHSSVITPPLWLQRPTCSVNVLGEKLLPTLNCIKLRLPFMGKLSSLEVFHEAVERDRFSCARFLSVVSIAPSNQPTAFSASSWYFVIRRDSLRSLLCVSIRRALASRCHW